MNSFFLSAIDRSKFKKMGAIMPDKEEMIKLALETLRSDRSLWPTEYTEQQSENYLHQIESLSGPSLNSAGVPISKEDLKELFTTFS